MGSGRGCLVETQIDVLLKAVYLEKLSVVRRKSEGNAPWSRTRTRPGQDRCDGSADRLSFRAYARQPATLDTDFHSHYAMIDVKDKPQILQHLEKSLTVTIYDTKCATGLFRCTALPMRCFGVRGEHP